MTDQEEMPVSPGRTATAEELEANARAGAKLLDLYDPGWWHQDSGHIQLAAIDLSALDINSTGQCVLGQRYGEYRAGMAVLGLECRDEDSEPYGFSPPLGGDLDEDRANSDLLTRAWKELITARRNTR